MGQGERPRPAIIHSLSARELSSSSSHLPITMRGSVGGTARGGGGGTATLGCAYAGECGRGENQSEVRGPESGNNIAGERGGLLITRHLSLPSGCPPHDGWNGPPPTPPPRGWVVLSGRRTPWRARHGPQDIARGAGQRQPKRLAPMGILPSPAAGGSPNPCCGVGVPSAAAKHCRPSLPATQHGARPRAAIIHGPVHPESRISAPAS